MENFFSRYKNPLVLMAVLFIQVIALATQVKRPENPRAANPGGGTRLIRVWTVTALTPFERSFVSTGRFFRTTWHNYIDLHDARRENLQLKEEVSRLKMEQVQLRHDAEQAQRLQALLGFKERYIGHVVPAQVIATSGTDQSHLITIDKGQRDGIKPEMAVVTPDGIVGKVKEVYPISSQVLMVNDRDSGAGVILQNSRLQGVLKGTQQGELMVSDIMSDEKVEAGEQVMTSGGDRIFPKGYPVGTVVRVSPDRETDPFLAIHVKPAADLNRLEEVLVVTTYTQDTTTANSSTPLRAADILAQRLPSAPKPEETPKKGTSAAPTGTAPSATKKPATPAVSTSPSPQNTAAAAATKPNSTAAASAQSGEAKPLAKPSPSPAGTNAAITVTKPAGSTMPTATATKPAANAPAAQKKPAVAAPSPSGQTAAPAASGIAKPPSPAVKKPKPQASPSPSTAQQQITPQMQQPAADSQRPPQ